MATNPIMMARPLNTLLFLIAIAFACLHRSTGFSPLPRSSLHNKEASFKLHLFGDAFKNDKTLGKPVNAGLNKDPNYVDVTINGKPVKAVVNQKVSQVAAAARVPIQYSCRKGDCATCSINMNGRIVKACQEKIPKGKCVIQTL